jgi:hypothetical protein
MIRRFLGEYSIDKRGFLIIAILFVSVFGWYNLAVPMINSILIQSESNITQIQDVCIWVTFYFSIIGSSILGTFLSKKVGILKFLYIWTILGIVTSLLPSLLTKVSYLQVWSLSLLLGVSFGLGIPSFLAYFAGRIVIENRGRIMGIALFIAVVSAPLLAIPFKIFALGTISIFFALLRGMGLLIFFLKPQRDPFSQVSSVSFFSILRNKSFNLYFIVWFIFPLIDQFEGALVIPFLTSWIPNLIDIMYIIEPIVASFSILIAGLLCDWIGRKKIVLSGFFALGVGYAIIGLFRFSVISWYLYFIVDGIAWGIFLLIFVLILWGDLSQPGTREKYYALGSIPFFLSNVIPEFLTASFVEQISLSAAFSLASFFLFIAVLPLLYASETLPEKKMELRRLRSFADDAKKMREKYENKI